MRCPNLEELPWPPRNKTGWPWTEETPQLPDRLPDGSVWPRITIVTPSFNQGGFIEETIRSVLLQGYPDLEYIIIDGGSSDESFQIIQKYSRFLAFWVSEPDRGQSHAINKGFSKATGHIYAYLNSDDLYEPRALENVNNAISELKPKKPFLIAGRCSNFDAGGPLQTDDPRWPEKLADFLTSPSLPQPATFWSKDLFAELAGFDESLNFFFDSEFFLRMGLLGIAPILISSTLARFRDQPLSKTRSIRNVFFEESIRMIRKYGTALGLSEKQKNERVRETDKSRRYLQVWINWKDKGRFAAILEFFDMVSRYPDLIAQRDILGLARRLLLMRIKDVFEFQKIFKRPADL
jgi:glycosyltransferase involved in cell wall biosynthesis